MDLSSLAESTDKQLLKAYISCQDETAFAELVSRHSSMLKRVCWRIVGNEQDADDAVQAVFMVLAKRARLIAWQSCIANWLYGTAWRIANRELKRRKKFPRQDIDMETVPQSRSSPDELEACERELYPLISRLPTRYRTAIILCYLEGKSRKQASLELGLSESVVKGRLERGRELLRKQLNSSHSDKITLLSSGALATLIAQSSLSAEQVHRLTSGSLSYAATASTSSTSALSIQLANGESTMLLASFQAKTVLIACGLAGATGGLGWVISNVMQPTPVATAPANTATANAVDQSENEQKDLATKRHLQAIVYAIHAYADANEGKLPPASVPNPNLPIEKRLSGLVLLLPYLGVRPSYIEENNPEWKAWHADNQRARAIYAKIDLTKAWDDPANAAAAKSIVPEFLCPLEPTTTNDKQMGLTHFALVRGGLNRDNGMFPLSGKQDLAISNINDGTSATVAVGQVHDKPGPWIAAGDPTARFLNPVSDKTRPGFGSPIDGMAYFANGDSFTYCLDLPSVPANVIDLISGRDDRQLFDMDSLKKYPSLFAKQKTK